MKNKQHTDFIRLYDPLHDQFYLYCRAISGNSSDGDDLLQDAVLNVLESFDKIKDKKAFKPYLYSVACNLHKMKLRRKKFSVELNDDEVRHILDTTKNQEYLTDFRILYETVLSLPDRMAETIILFHISDLSMEEIQKIQGGSLSGVKLRLKRGREKLLSRLSTPAETKMALLFLTL